MEENKQHFLLKLKIQEKFNSTSKTVFKYIKEYFNNTSSTLKVQEKLKQFKYLWSPSEWSMTIPGISLIGHKTSLDREVKR